MIAIAAAAGVKKYGICYHGADADCCDVVEETDNIIIDQNEKTEVKKMGKLTWEAIENNGGGLALVVRNASGECIYIHDNYEYHDAGSMLADIKALLAGDDPREWDGCTDPAEQIIGFRAGAYGYDYDQPVYGTTLDDVYAANYDDDDAWRNNCLVLVAAGDNDGITLYPDKMGIAARQQLLPS